MVKSDSLSPLGQKKTKIFEGKRGEESQSRYNNSESYQRRNGKGFFRLHYKLGNGIANHARKVKK